MANSALAKRQSVSMVQFFVLKHLLHGRPLLSKVLVSMWRAKICAATFLVMVGRAAVSLFGQDGFLWVFMSGLVLFLVIL
jgi:hypothetical protein